MILEDTYKFTHTLTHIHTHFICRNATSELCGEVSTTLWQCEKEGAYLHGDLKQREALRVQILCMSCKEKKQTQSTPISKLKGETQHLLAPAQTSGDLRCSLRIQPLSSALFQLVGRDWELWPTLNCEDTVPHTAAATSGKMGPGPLCFLLHSTAEPTNRNIYCMWNAILLSVFLGFRWPEGKREGRRRDRMSKEMPCKSQGWLQWFHPAVFTHLASCALTQSRCYSTSWRPSCEHHHGTLYRCPGLLLTVTVN